MTEPAAPEATSIRVELRMTPELRDQAQRAAAKKGLTLSSWARMIFTAEIRKDGLRR